MAWVIDWVLNGFFYLAPNALIFLIIAANSSGSKAHNPDYLFEPPTLPSPAQTSISSHANTRQRYMLLFNMIYGFFCCNLIVVSWVLHKFFALSSEISRKRTTLFTRQTLRSEQCPRMRSVSILLLHDTRIIFSLESVLFELENVTCLCCIFMHQIGISPVLYNLLCWANLLHNCFQWLLWYLISKMH